MLAKLKRLFNKIFFMSKEDYDNIIVHYIEKFQLKEKWNFSLVNSFPIPEEKMNYHDINRVVACTDWVTKSVLFKDELMAMPKVLARAYIRHELRHCQQMEKIHELLLKKEGELLANIYTCIIITNDNKNGYDKSMMEADAWAAFFGINLNIKKVVRKIINNSMPFIME